MQGRITKAADSYYDALDIIGKYVNITGPDEEMDEDMDMGM